MKNEFFNAAVRRVSGPVLLTTAASLICMVSFSSCEKKRPELSEEQQLKNIEAEIEAETSNGEAESTEE